MIFGPKIDFFFKYSRVIYHWMPVSELITCFRTFSLKYRQLQTVAHKYPIVAERYPIVLLRGTLLFFVSNQSQNDLAKPTNQNVVFFL